MYLIHLKIQKNISQRSIIFKIPRTILLKISTFLLQDFASRNRKPFD